MFEFIAHYLKRFLPLLFSLSSYRQMKRPLVRLCDNEDNVRACGGEDKNKNLSFWSLLGSVWKLVVVPNII